eukprot:3303920-Prymnesium_polylepis.1
MASDPQGRVWASRDAPLVPALRRAIESIRSGNRTRHRIRRAGGAHLDVPPPLLRCAGPSCLAAGACRSNPKQPTLGRPRRQLLADQECRLHGQGTDGVFFSRSSLVAKGAQYKDVKEMILAERLPRGEGGLQRKA